MCLSALEKEFSWNALDVSLSSKLSAPGAVLHFLKKTRFRSPSLDSTFGNVLTSLSQRPGGSRNKSFGKAPYISFIGLCSISLSLRLVSIRRTLQAWHEKLFVSLFSFMRAALLLVTYAIAACIKLNRETIFHATPAMYA